MELQALAGVKAKVLDAPTLMLPRHCMPTDCRQYAADGPLAYALHDP